jgi:pimeloyl-ACP methyl ester carboxylesterase
LTDEILALYFDPIISSPERRANFNRYWTSFDPAQTLAIESKLKTLQVPTLIIWALEDVFFDVKWAYWLKDTIPGTTKVVEVPHGKLFFAEDRPETVIPHVRAHWARTGCT